MLIRVYNYLSTVKGKIVLLKLKRKKGVFKCNIII